MSGTTSTTQEKTDKNEKLKSLKIMLIGEAAVGKSSIMYRYTMNSFKLNMLGTAGIDFKKKEIVVNNEPIKIVLYDTAGHERFRKIIKNHCKGANGIVLVYDIGEEKSIERLSTWMTDIEENSDKGVEIILIGSKSDIEPRKITEEQGKELSLKYNVPIIETSAKTGHNIDLLFDMLINNILSKERKVESSNKQEIDIKKNEIVNINQTKKKPESVGCQCLIF